MSASLAVAAILVAGWNLTLVLTAFLTETGIFQLEGQSVRGMNRSLMDVRAEVGKPEFDARINAWKREGGINTAEYGSRVIETSKQITMQVPYAETSVSVVDEEGDEARRCSVCLN